MILHSKFKTLGNHFQLTVSVLFVHIINTVCKMFDTNTVFSMEYNEGNLLRVILRKLRIVMNYDFWRLLFLSIALKV